MSDSQVRSDLLRALHWELPPAENHCRYPDVVFDPALNFTQNGGCDRLYVTSQIRSTWTEKAYARAWMEDRTLVDAITRGLVRVPLEGDDYSLHNNLSLHDDPDTDMASTNMDMIALSYVHHDKESTYGLAKLPEPVEKALIDGVRRRAKTRGVDKVFIWSDQTIKGRVDQDIWLKVGVYAYAVLSGLVLPTRGYCSRMWPMVEFSLLESCSGFIIDLGACRHIPGFDTEALATLSNSASTLKNRVDLDCPGFGNTTRDGVAIMAKRFLTTQLGILETHYQNDRLLLRDICVSFLKGEKSHSIGHHLLCDPQCAKRKKGSLTNFMDGISGRAFLKDPDYSQGSALWGAVSLLAPGLNVFRTKTGFIDTIHNALLSSAWRTLLPVEGIPQFFTAVRTLTSKFFFSSTSGYTGVLHVINFRMDWEKKIDTFDCTLPYWSAPAVLAWIEIEADEYGNKKWPGASMQLGQTTTVEIDTLLRLYCRFHRRPKVKKEAKTSFEKTCMKTVDIMRYQVMQFPENEVKGQLLQKINELRLNNKSQDALLEEDVIDIIAQEIEMHAMVQQTGILELTDHELKMPYADIESAGCDASTMRLVMEKMVDPEKKALHWIFVEDSVSRMRETVGMCGRLCMTAVAASLGLSELKRFLESESPSIFFRNRADGKRRAMQNYSYVLLSNGIWFGREQKEEDTECKSFAELPLHAMIVYEEEPR